MEANTEMLSTPMHSDSEHVQYHFCGNGSNNDSSSNIAKFEKEKLLLQQMLSDLNEELCDMRKKLSSSDENVQLQKQEIGKMIVDRDEREVLIRVLQTQLSKSSHRKNETEQKYEELLRRQDEYDHKFERIVNEKSSLMAALREAKEEQSKHMESIFVLRNQLNETLKERNSVEVEKDQWKEEKVVLLSEREWFFNEIIARDKKLTDSRLEMVCVLEYWQAANVKLAVECDAQKQELSIVTMKLKDREQEGISLNERIEELLEETDTKVKKLEEIASKSDKTISAYKEMAECAESELNKLNEKYEERGNLLNELKLTFENVNAKFIAKVHDLEAQLQAKDVVIRELNDEIGKANDLLQSTHRSMSRSGDEMAELSQTVAAATTFANSGMSLTHMYKKHCEVVAELEKTKHENKRIESHFRNLLEDVENKAHILTQPNDECSKMTSAYESVTKQLQLVQEEKLKLVSSRDVLSREISNAKAQLERCQRDNDYLSRQVRHLLHAIEIERLPSRNGASIPLIGNDDRNIVWSSIGELQQANLRLASELREARINQNKLAEEGRATEMKRLHVAWDEALCQLNLYKQQNEKYAAVIEKLREEFESYKCSTMGTRTEAEFITLSSRCAEYEATINDLEEKATRMQLSFKLLTLEKEESDRRFQDQFAVQFDSLSELNRKNAKLEREIELQKHLQNIAREQSNTAEMQLLRKNNRKLTADLESLRQKSVELENELSRLTSDGAQMRDEIDLKNEEIYVLRRKQESLLSELSVFHENMGNFKQMSIVMDQIQVRLEQQLIQKTSNSSSQLDILRKENEELRKSNGNITKQHSVVTYDLKMASDRIASERDHAIMRAESAEREMMLKTKEFEALQNKHNELVMQLSSPTVSIGMSGEFLKKEAQMLRNKNNHLQNQLKALLNKYEDAKVKFAINEQEMSDVVKLSSTMESALLEQTSFSEAERENLRAALKLSEDQLTKSNETICDLRREIACLQQRAVEENLNSRQADVDAQERICEFEKQFNDINAELITAKSEIRSLEDQLQNKDAEIVKIESDRNRCRKELVLIEKSLYDTRQELKNREISFAEGVAHANEIEQNSASEIASLRAENSRITELLNESNKTNADNLKKMEEQIENVVKLTDSIVYLERTRNNSVALSNDSTASLATLSSVIHYLKRENAQSLEQCVKSELQLRHTQAHQSVLDAERFKLEEEIKQLRTQLEGGARESAEMASHLSLFQAVDAENCSLKEELKRTKENFDRSTQAVNELSSRLKSSEVQRTSTENQLEHLSSDLINLQSQCTLWKERYTQSLEMLSRKADELNREIEMLKNKLITITSERDSLKEERSNRQNADESTRKELERVQRANEELAARFEQVRVIGRKYRMQSQTLEKEKEELEKQLAEKIATCSNRAVMIVGPESGAIARFGALSHHHLKRMDTINQENVNLKKQLDEQRLKLTENSERVFEPGKLERESDDDAETKDELKFRLKSITSMIQKKDVVIEKLRQDIEHLTGTKRLSEVPASEDGTDRVSVQQTSACPTSVLSDSTADVTQVYTPEVASSKSLNVVPPEFSVLKTASQKLESSIAMSEDHNFSNRSEIEVQNSAAGPVEKTSSTSCIESDSAQKTVEDAESIALENSVEPHLASASVSSEIPPASLISSSSSLPFHHSKTIIQSNAGLTDLKSDISCAVVSGSSDVVSSMSSFNVPVTGQSFFSLPDLLTTMRKRVLERTREQSSRNETDFDRSDHNKRSRINLLEQTSNIRNDVEAGVLEDSVQTNDQEVEENVLQPIKNIDQNEISLVDDNDSSVEYLGSDDQNVESDDMSFSDQEDYDEENLDEEMLFGTVDEEGVLDDEGDCISQEQSSDDGDENIPVDHSLDEACDETFRTYGAVGQLQTYEQHEADVESTEDICAVQVENHDHDLYELPSTVSVESVNRSQPDNLSMLTPIESAVEEQLLGDSDQAKYRSIYGAAIRRRDDQIDDEAGTSEPSTSDSVSQRRIRIRVPEIDEPSSSSRARVRSLFRNQNLPLRPWRQARRSYRGHRFIR